VPARVVIVDLVCGDLESPRSLTKQTVVIGKPYVAVPKAPPH
jgi:hypothetical protein